LILGFSSPLSVSSRKRVTKNDGLADVSNTEQFIPWTSISNVEAEEEEEEEEEITGRRLVPLSLLLIFPLHHRS